MEAHSACQPGVTTLASHPSAVKMDIASIPPVSERPSTSIPPVVKIEPSSLFSTVSGSAFLHVPCVFHTASKGVPSLKTTSPTSASQEMISNDNDFQDLKPIIRGSFIFTNFNMSGNSNIGIPRHLDNLQGGVSMGQSVSGMSQGNIPGAQMVKSEIGMKQNVMSCAAPSRTGTVNPTPEITQQGMQSLGVNDNSVANLPMSQQTSRALQSSQSKYVKFWEGNLSGQNQGQPIFITKLEGYRTMLASETLAANWPPAIQIVGLISQDHVTNKQYPRRACFLVFRAMKEHGFLEQLQEKKLFAVIELPSQTLLLSVSDKACRLIGMLLPEDMVVFMPQNSSQQQHQQLPMSEQKSSALQSAKSKYVKFWEGKLFGQRRGQSIFITRLRGYRRKLDSEMLANWPPTLQIVQLISQDHLSNKHYTGKACFLVFWVMNDHGFLGQMKEQKLCAVIQLQTHTLLLSVSDKACRLIGMLTPGATSIQSAATTTTTTTTIVPTTSATCQKLQPQQQLQQFPQLQRTPTASAAAIPADSTDTAASQQEMVGTEMLEVEADPICTTFTTRATKHFWKEFL